MRQLSNGHRDEPPIVLVKWYDVTKWPLERVAARVPDAVQRMCDVVFDVVAVLAGRTPKFPAQAEADEEV